MQSQRILVALKLYLLVALVGGMVVISGWPRPGPARAALPGEAGVGGFIFPVDCVLNVECFYVNYVDEDPGPGIQDWACGLETYDGHFGTDITLKDFRLMDEGVDVYAAAAGTVLGVKDGHFDRNKEVGLFPANLVEIEHADGLRTLYLHLRSGSIAVTVGESVVQGQKLAEVGSSGSSTQPHLHFEVVDSADNVVDPWAGPCGNTVSLWAAQDSYEDDFLLIDDYLLAEFPSGNTLKQGPPSVSALPESAFVMCYAVQVLSVHPGDTSEIRFVGPGSVPPFVISNSQYFRHTFQGSCALASTLKLNFGHWEAQYWFNGKLVSSRAFTVLLGVGGIAELPEVAQAPLEAGGSSGPSAAMLAGVTVAAGAGLVALGGAAWYVRRRPQ